MLSHDVLVTGLAWLSLKRTVWESQWLECLYAADTEMVLDFCDDLASEERLLHESLWERGISDLTESVLAATNLRGADLSGIDLSHHSLDGTDLSGTNLTYANLSGAMLTYANLIGADLSNADLCDTNLSRANLTHTNLSGANLEGTDLSGANLTGTDLARADLFGTNLEGAILAKANLEGTECSYCKINGIQAVELDLSGTHQSDLIVSRHTDSVEILVDSFHDARHLIWLANGKTFNVTRRTRAASRLVLIVGCYYAERQATIDAVRQELRRHQYIPVVCDIVRPISKSQTNPIEQLALQAHFAIVDMNHLPKRLEAILWNLPPIPLQPILRASSCERKNASRIKNRPWILGTYCYENLGNLITSFERSVIVPLEDCAKRVPRR